MSAKRRVGSAGSPEIPVHVLKRRKVSGSHATDTETSQATKDAGLDLLALIKQSTDKNGRLIATGFLHLPEKKKNPDYYKAIALPIALDTVENKLNNHEYSTITALESDLKRMITNAKSYNDKTSLTFADAERIRKILSNTMPKINPAYKDPKYIAFPTPVPENVWENAEDEDEESREDQKAEESVAASPWQDSNGTPSDDRVPADEGFEGDTIQDAQNKIISELIHLKDSQGTNVGAPFLHKPDRELYKEYYEVILHPVSLRTIHKQVRGIEGRKPHSHKTAFPTWQSFVNEVEYVWRNAREFNEEGSEIVDYAGTLENHFWRRVDEAKKVVTDPVQADGDSGTPRIKLKIGNSQTPEPSSQRLTLRLPGQKGNAASSEGKPQSAASRDGDASKAREELIGADMEVQGDTHGTMTTTRSLRNSVASPFSNSRGGIGSHAVPPESSASSPSKSHVLASSGPAGVSSHEASPNISMNSGSPSRLPVMDQNESSRAHSSRSIQNQSTSHYSPLDSIWREPGQDATNALIKNVTIRTHSSSDFQRRLCLNIPPSVTVKQRSMVITLPASHNFVSVKLNTVASTPEKRTKFLAFIGSQRLYGVAQSESTSEPVYDIRLPPGMTKVDFQAVAVLSNDLEADNTSGPEKDFERLTIFFRVLR